ncbi:MAG TPA: polysaccharide pyruvyl transferase family protein [Gemmatimonadaceae bacterium]|nr:polysaccharide pyruvyl transferase family protein [Gemmatimonadaceae bacterium]HRQ78805.1 polysaccharide pyruvyl transferase family protein [Gemmatimonadaceae bacterium]
MLALLLVPARRTLRLLGWRPSGITIIGWWGSETAGDIAILGQLLAEVDEVARELRPTIVSFDADLTRRSLAALNRSTVRVLPLGLGSAWTLVSAKAVMFGGGPLMESPTLPIWAMRAAVARLAGVRVMLYGNGIGPLRSARASRAVAALLRLSTQVALRDGAAQQWARQHVPEVRTARTFDPAFDFVRSSLVPSVRREPMLALALRAPPAAYLGVSDASDATEATDRFVSLLASTLDGLLDRHDLSLEGIVMHTGFAGSDDHVLFERLRAKLRHPHRLYVTPGVHSPTDVIATLQRAQAALTVRFHAMIFALATETPFVAIDYARPAGKVSAAADDIGRSAEVIAWDALDVEVLTERLEAALASAPVTPPDLGAEQETRRRMLADAVA